MKPVTTLGTERKTSLETCPEEFKLAPTTCFQDTGVGNVILFANDSLLDFPLQLELP